MAGTFETTTPQILRRMRSGSSEINHRIASRVLEESNKNAPHPGHSQGYSVGALIASGYRSSAKLGTKEYDAAIEAAKAVPNTRIEERGQILPPTVPYDSGESNSVFVDYPLSYAALMELGFWHARAQTFIPGSYFLYDATVTMASEFNKAYYDLLREVSLIRILTPQEKTAIAAQKQADAEELYRHRMLAEGAAAARRDARELKNDFFAAYGHDVMKRETGDVKGYRRTRYGMVPVRFRETAGERDERVERLYQEWLSNRDNGYR